MRSYSNLSLRDLLDAFASTAPAPGGGSAAALAGAIGVSLLVMALGIRTARPMESGESRELADAADRLRSLRPTIAALIDRDSEAYAAVIAALRMPAGDDNSTARRRAAYESALRGATDVPLETMRACRRALREAPVVAAHGISRTHGDIGVAIELLRAAVRSAGLTIDANVASLGDTDYAREVRAERERLDTESTADAEYGLSQLSGKVRLKPDTTERSG
jgi:formiminotetrahydrofolate cyclodeaminase